MNTHCVRCARPVSKPSHRYCAPCRAQVRRKPRKYHYTEWIDQKIRHVYAAHHGTWGQGIPGLTDLAKSLGWPKWAITRRGRELGLARTKEQPWSRTELRIITQFAWMNDITLARKLKHLGFSRTPTAIHLKLKRERLKSNGGWYSATTLAECFGCDPKTIIRWIHLGLLKATRRGHERTTQQGGDTYLIYDHHIRQFIFRHPTDFDIRKVDQLWFIDLLTAGKATT